MSYTSWADIKTREDARQHIDQIVEQMADVADETTVLNSLRTDARVVQERTDCSVLEDATDRNVGASLVLLELNRKAGTQK